MSRFVYGVNPVLEALKAHPKDVVRVLVERGHEGRTSRGADRVGQAAADAGVRVEDVPQGDLAHRSCSGAHQGVGAELTQFRYAELEDVLSLSTAGPCCWCWTESPIRRTWAPSRAAPHALGRSGHRGSQGPRRRDHACRVQRRPPARWSTVRWPASPISLARWI